MKIHAPRNGAYRLRECPKFGFRTASIQENP